MPTNESSKNRGLRAEARSCRSEIKRLSALIAAISEERDYFSQIFNNSSDGIIIHDVRGRILEINEPYCRRLGYNKAEMLGMSLGDLVSPELSRLIPQRMRLLRKTGTAIFESQDRRKDGTVMPVEVSATYVKFRGRNVIQSIVRDIHKHKLAEELIRATLADNARLLKEVRWQSQFISAVFNKVLVKIADGIHSGSSPESLCLILSHQRFRAANIALVQKMLFRSPMASMVDIEALIRRLVPFNFSQFGINPCRISTLIDAGGIFMDHARAVPFCLLVAELLLNSLQHAFPENIPGEIEIRLTQEASGVYMLVFADTGVGLPKEFWLQRFRTLGMHLVLDLVDQLEGKVRLLRGRGTRFVIRFG